MSENENVRLTITSTQESFEHSDFCVVVDENFNVIAEVCRPVNVDAKFRFEKFSPMAALVASHSNENVLGFISCRVLRWGQNSTEVARALHSKMAWVRITTPENFAALIDTKDSAKSLVVDRTHPVLAKHTEKNASSQYLSHYSSKISENITSVWPI